MREILFRGKTLSGAWKYGYFLKSVNFDEDSIAVITDNKIPEYVLKNTIGQYTGLTANGTKIFEGDIVRVLLHGNPQPVGIVEYGNRGICSYTVLTQAPYSNYLLDNPEDFEVIGNIHDNPELLKGAKK